MSRPDLISGGFFITRTISKPAYLGEALLPAQLLTLSSCLTEFLPDVWALDWTTCSTDERLAAMSTLGLPVECLPTLMKEATEAFNREELGWPCVWQSATAARAAFSLVKEPFMLLELGVPQEAAAMLLTELAPQRGEATCGLLKRLKSAHPLSSPSVPLGWEILGAEHGGSFHSWLCNSLQDEAATKLQITPGPLGLLASAHDAQTVVDLIDSDIGAEPVPWFRGLLSQII